MLVLALEFSRITTTSSTLHHPVLAGGRGTRKDPAAGNRLGSVMKKDQKVTPSKRKSESSAPTTRDLNRAAWAPAPEGTNGEYCIRRCNRCRE